MSVHCLPYSPHHTDTLTRIRHANGDTIMATNGNRGQYVAHSDLALCIDCTMLVANGAETSDEHTAAVRNRWDRGPVDARCTLHVTCSEDHGHGCDDFSRRHCDGCGSWLAGERHRGVALARKYPIAVAVAKGASLRTGLPMSADDVVIDRDGYATIDDMDPDEWADAMRMD